ncbi:MAG: GAF domain-containing protein [Bacteroidetes bacterium]|nr:GAF domain-containing protein [Bacteroidota bacterium]
MTNHTHELKRIETLHKYELLDTPPDGSFNKMTELAAKIFNVPIAIISLVDTDRIWFKSRHGLDIDQIPREPGLCASAILSDDVYLIEDAKNDPRCMANPLVTSNFGLEFYAAAPLTTKDGYNLGTFCIIDKRQRYINSDQQIMLKQMASIIVDEIELRLKSRHLIKEYKAKLEELQNKLD